jgi:hypothetical protein
VKEIPNFGSSHLGAFPSDRIPKSTKDVNVQVFIHSSNSVNYFNLTLFVPMFSMFKQSICILIQHIIFAIKSTYKATCFGPIGPSSGLIIRAGLFTSSTFWDPKLFTT